MSQEGTDPINNSNGASLVPGQVAAGVPPITWGGSFSSMAPAAQKSAPGPLAQVPNEGRAAAEAAAGDALSAQLQFARAWDRYRQALELDPSNGAYHFKLGVAAWRAGRRDSAERSFLDALRFAPNYADAHDALGRWCTESGQMERALKHSQAAVLLGPRNHEYLISRAAVLAADGQVSAAWELIEPLLNAGTRDPRLAMVYARIAARLGHEPQAVIEVERALQAGVPRMLQRGLHFAAASLLDRLKHYDEAFVHARRANELHPRTFDRAGCAAAIDRQIAYFTSQRIRCLPKSTVDSGRTVFIVGMPRTGTTLVEQILASHPGVFGAGESPALLQIVRSLADATWAEGARFPSCLDSLSISAADRLARRYSSAVDPPAGVGAVFVTDKMPLNGLYLGLVQLLLPDCHVIHCTRGLLDTCLSCFFTDFVAAVDFAHDLKDAGFMYRHYRRLMTHWKQVLTIPMLEVGYEDLVLDLEGQARRITDFLHLPWDDRCLKFYENPRHVHTAAREQVRQPIYASSIGRWKNYQKHLSGLIDAVAAE